MLTKPDGRLRFGREADKVMAKKRKTRAPVQQRSVEKKGKILDAAYKVFCAKGFYKTTTVEIARRAGVSIGSLYSYFVDKNDLFSVVLDRYDSEFDALRARTVAPVGGKARTPAETVRTILTALLEEHEASRALNREIKMLSFSDPAIAARVERQAEKIQEAVRANLASRRGELRLADLDAAAVVIWKTISGVVDCLVFEPPVIDRQRIIEATVDALSAYVLK